MIINIPKLTDLQSNHSYYAEIAIMNALSYHYDLNPGGVSTGNFAEYDFIVNNRTFELKVSSKGTSNGVMELSRADGTPAGLSASKADFYIFLNSAGSIGKLRIIKTSALKLFYKGNRNNTFTIQTQGGKLGSILAPLDFKKFNDLMVLECQYNFKKKEFDTHTFKTNPYAKKMLHNFIN